MHLAKLLVFVLLLAVLAALLVREALRRYLIHYEYRINSFSVIGPFGRQLFQIRQSEIEFPWATFADRTPGGRQELAAQSPGAQGGDPGRAWSGGRWSSPGRACRSRA